MAKKDLKALERSYEVENFYEYIIDSYVNGNFSQAEKLIHEMRRRDRAQLLVYVSAGDYDHALRYQNERAIEDLIDSLA